MPDDTKRPEVFPETIANLQELPDQDAVAYIYRVYTPILAAILAKRTRSSPDAESVQDIIQRFVAEKLLADPARNRPAFVERWDPSRGRFRCFLMRSFDNFVHSTYRQRKRIREVQAADEFDVALPYEAVDIRSNTVGWVHAVYCIALARMEAKCKPLDFQIFHLREIEPRLTTSSEPLAYAELEARFGLTSGKLTGILRRARTEFDRILRTVIREHFVYVSQEDMEHDFRLAKEVLASPNYASEMAFLLQQIESTEKADADRERRDRGGLDATQVGSTFRTSNLTGKDSEPQLTALLDSELTRLAIDTTGGIAAVATQLPIGVQTLGQLFDRFLNLDPNRERPSLEQLKELKDAFAANSSSMHKREWQAIYCALTAAAVIGFGDRAVGGFTRNSKDEILRNIRKAMRFPDLPPTVRHLLAETLESLELT